MSTPGAAWGCGRLFLAVHWAGSHGGEGGSRGVQVVCGFLFSRGDGGDPWRGEKGACGGGVFVSPQGLLCCLPSSRVPGRLSEECSVLWDSWFLSGWGFLFVPQPMVRRPRRKMQR